MKWQNNFKKSNLPRESLIDLTTFQVEKAKNELLKIQNEVWGMTLT